MELFFNIADEMVSLRLAELKIGTECISIFIPEIFKGLNNDLGEIADVNEQLKII